MPTTTTHGFPVPLDSDPVADGAAATRALGEAVDDRVGAIAAGTVSVTNGAAAATASAAVAFPPGRFAAAPRVVATCVNTSVFNAYLSAPDATGCTITVRRFDGATFTGGPSVHWIAIDQS